MRLNIYLKIIFNVFNQKTYLKEICDLNIYVSIKNIFIFYFSGFSGFLSEKT